LRSAERLEQTEIGRTIAPGDWKLIEPESIAMQAGMGNIAVRLTMMSRKWTRTGNGAGTTRQIGIIPGLMWEFTFTRRMGEEIQAILQKADSPESAFCFFYSSHRQTSAIALVKLFGATCLQI
jgi:hypothetical protein